MARVCLFVNYLTDMRRINMMTLHSVEHSSNPVMLENCRPVNLCIYRGHQFGPPKKFFRGKILEEVDDVMSMLVTSPCACVGSPCACSVLSVTDNYGIGFDDIITDRNMIYV